MARAADHGHDAHATDHHDAVSHIEPMAHGGGHHGLHFYPPLLGKNPTPVTEVRFDYIFKDRVHKEGESSTIRVVGEYAINRNFSVELGIPYTFVNEEGHVMTHNLDTVDFGLKFASFAFEDEGVVLGGGIDIGFPTGSHHKHIGEEDSFEIEPFLSLGWTQDEWEVAADIGLLFPAGGTHKEPDSEFVTHFSILYHATDRLRPFIELDSEHINGGKHDGDFIMAVTPGVKFVPMGNVPHLEVGVGLRMPLRTSNTAVPGHVFRASRFSLRKVARLVSSVNDTTPSDVMSRISSSVCGWPDMAMGGCLQR